MRNDSFAKHGKTKRCLEFTRLREEENKTDEELKEIADNYE